MLFGDVSTTHSTLSESCVLINHTSILNEVYKEVAPWGKPGYILFVQTFGDLVTFHPHIHALVADGIFVESGTFRVLPPIPTVLLAEPLRHAVLDYLVEDKAITEEFAHRFYSKPAQVLLPQSLDLLYI